jgi:RNA polymerase sigma factor (sigma-70 family)
MGYPRKLRLLDKRGSPLDARIEAVLERLLPRFQRQFPAIRDEFALTEIFEEAGRRIANRERRQGAIEKLHGYAWVTLRSVAASWMRRSASRVTGRTLASDESEAVLSTVPSPSGTPEQIEQEILLREILAQLTPEERLVCVWKKAGFSSQEIAHHRGSSVAAVDTLFSRAKDKIRRLLGVQKAGRPQPIQKDTSPETVRHSASVSDTGADTSTERADGEPRGES